jgi:hypothetical protein
MGHILDDFIANILSLSSRLKLVNDLYNMIYFLHICVVVGKKEIFLLHTLFLLTLYPYLSTYLHSTQATPKKMVLLLA